MPDVEGDVLDVGCGYGPIGLSIAASFPSRKVHMVDVNERALLLSAKNAEHNGITNAKFIRAMHCLLLGCRIFRDIDESTNSCGRKKLFLVFMMVHFRNCESVASCGLLSRRNKERLLTIDHLAKTFWQCRDYREEKRLSYY